MNVIEYESEQYNFKKAMQDNINKSFAEMLLSNGFKKYKANKYAREREQIVHIITFQIEKDRMKVYSMFIPIFVGADYYLEYGIQLTGGEGCRLLDGKYFTTLYEEEKKNQEVQYKNYCKKHVVALQKIFSAIKEGVIPEMDEIDSLNKFVSRLKHPDACFFGNTFLPAKRNGWLYKYIVGVYECAYGNFEDGVKILKQIETNDETMLKSLEKLNFISREDFIASYKRFCDEMRKYYKFTK